MSPLQQARATWMQTKPPRTKDGKVDPRAVGRWRVDRLWAFHDWLNLEIAARFQMPAGTERQKALGQFKGLVLASVRELNARGFLLDGEALERFIVEKFAAIAEAQRKGGIRNLWTYWREAWRKYVAVEADRLKAESMDAGQHIAAFTAGLDPANSLPAIVAAKHALEQQETLRKTRHRQARKAAQAGQQTLF